MTEQEWLGCTDPGEMLEFVRDKASDRKLRLFACACTRRVWEPVWTPEGPEPDRAVVEAVERFADEPADSTKLATVRAGASLEVELLACEDASGAAWWATEELPMAMTDWRGEAAPQSALLRDIFNPFRPVHIDPAWLTYNDGTIPKLAHSIYTDRAFDRMPILADALEEDGCEDAEILGHCRQPGLHARGCWLIDLLTGRS